MKDKALKSFFSMQNISLRYKLLWITSLSLLLTGLVSLMGYSLVLKASNSLLHEQSARVLVYLAQRMSDQLESIHSLSLSLSVTGSNQEALSVLADSNDGIARSVATQVLTQALYRTDSSRMLSIAFYPVSSRVILWGKSSYQEPEEPLLRLKALCREQEGGVVWLPSSFEDGTVLCAREIRETRNFTLRSLGYIIIRFNLKDLVDEIIPLSDSGAENRVAVFNREQLLYPPPGSNASYPELLEGFSEAAPYTIYQSGKEAFFVTRTPLILQKLNWTLAMSVPYTHVTSTLQRSNLIYTAFTALAIVGALCVAFLMTRSITSRFHLLVDKMDRLRKGNFQTETAPVPVGTDELGLLNRYFDEMETAFKATIEDNYVKQLLIAQTQLKALEQQMNPHFLYNCLESIGWFARRNGEENIPVVVEALGILLRSTLGEQEEVISVSKELSIVESYLKIQHIRFSDSLTVDLTASPDTLDLIIPKMSVQPLIENAIVHSLEESLDGCQVTVTISKRDAFLEVLVRNNGSEIAPNILELLHTRQITPRGNGIGLLNIDSRIKLIFGDSYGLSFESGNNATTARFVIPALDAEAFQINKERKNHAEHDYRRR